MILRTLSPGLALRLALRLALLFAGLCPAAAQPPVAEPAGERTFQQGVVIVFDGVILPRLERYLDRKLDAAQQLGADLLILEIHSPGGELDTTFRIIDRLRKLTGVRTVAYIPDEALSGAALVALACDEIVMGSQARLGDAGPVFQGPDALFRHAPEKIRSDLARRVRDLATATGRPPALAEAMVDPNLPVYRVVHKVSGQVRYMSEHELDASGEADNWERGPLVLESRPGSFLEVNGQRAVELQLAAATVNSDAQLAQRYALSPPLRRLAHDPVDLAVELLNTGWITALLLVIAAVALYIEFSAPGIGLGGLTAAFCVTLFFWSRFLGGTADWLEVILVLSGAAFLALEIFVLPGFGIAGITGLLLMAAGFVLASQNHLVPDSPRALAELGRSLIILLTAGVASVVAAALVARHFGSLPVLHRLVLKAPTAAHPGAASHPAQTLPPVRRFEAAVGDQGVAQCPLRPAGKASFGTELLDVVTDGSYVESGRPVRIIQISGNRIVVRELEEGRAEV